jgi:2-dehydro-3-deoxyglucarate aldolase
MNRADKLSAIRQALAGNGTSIGSWMQIPHASIAEIMGDAGFDWVAVDLEHGSIAPHQLPDLFRALELGNTLPLVRLAQGSAPECKQALDAGAGGVIVPMVESATQLRRVVEACRWPPGGSRGVGFSRANLFGKRFAEYQREAQAPLVVAMIEHVSAIEQLPAILAVDGLDAIFIGPYDLSASMGLTGQFSEPAFVAAQERIRSLAAAASIACGVHVVAPSREELAARIEEGYRFLAHSIDAAFLSSSLRNAHLPA